MFILVINGFGQSELINSDFIPRVGDKVDMFYKPSPTVNSVLLWPTDKTLSDTPYNADDVKAIVSVE